MAALQEQLEALEDAQVGVGPPSREHRNGKGSFLPLSSQSRSMPRCNQLGCCVCSLHVLVALQPPKQKSLEADAKRQRGKLQLGPELLDEYNRIKQARAGRLPCGLFSLLTS